MGKGYSEHLDKGRIASCFKASAATYEETAIVQKEISRQLIAVLKRFALDSEYPRALEIGCCTGNLTKMLSESVSIENLFLNDLVADFCNSTEARIAGQVGRVNVISGDIEKALLPSHLDLVISSSTFQWMVDLPRLIGKIAAVLNNAGLLAFSIFSPGTMGEISTLTGRGLRYHSSEELAAMLADNFQVLNLHSERKCLYFPSVRAVLSHIRQTGVGGLGQDRWTLGKLKDFEKRYVKQFSSEYGLPVTYNSTFVVARKKGGGS